MYLLDTHALIWFLSDDEKLSKSAMNSVCSENDVFVSVVSLWEIAIKKNIGKLRLDYTVGEIVDMCKEQRIGVLPIEFDALDGAGL